MYYDFFSSVFKVLFPLENSKTNTKKNKKKNRQSILVLAVYNAIVQIAYWQIDVVVNKNYY